MPDRGALTGLKIAIVEDRTEVREALAGFLRGRGALVVTCSGALIRNMLEVPGLKQQGAHVGRGVRVKPIMRAAEERRLKRRSSLAFC
jgi:hypothetical protein